MDKATALERTNELYSRLAQRRPEIEELDSAYEGDQKLKFASAEWTDFHQNQYQDFADNWVAVIADAVSERIEVTGVNLGSKDDYPEAETLLWEQWKRNDLETLSSQGFLQSIVTKRSMAIVWYGDDDPLQPLVTWEHPSQVYVRFSGDGVRRKRDAIKVWVEDDTEYANLFVRNELWKWQRPFLGVDVTDGFTNNGLYVGNKITSTSFGGGTWEPRMDEGDEKWPIPHDLGIPVVEFPNRPRLKSGAISDVAGALAMQNAINLFWAYLFGAADYASLPARVVMGQAPPKIPLLDKNGQVVGEQDVPLSELQKGRILWLTGQHAKVGEWSKADLQAFADIIEVAVGHLAAQSRTPAHYFVANKGLSNINGETLTATETPLVKKVDAFEREVQRPSRELWMLIAKVMGDERLAALTASADTQFANPAIRSDAQLADALAKDRSAGYPFEYLLEKYGETPANIRRIMEMKRAESVDPQLQALVDRVNEDVGF